MRCTAAWSRILSYAADGRTRYTRRGGDRAGRFTLACIRCASANFFWSGDFVRPID
jgi:hypothetical protein